MKFKDHKAIYLQIAESLCEKILNGKWNDEGRIPSVRELGATLGVNPNTVARTYDYLQQKKIIYNKRGIGYFVSPGARQEIVKTLKERFLQEELPEFMKRLSLLAIPFTDIEAYYNKLEK
ncbi:MAG: GntR family transcriptional regulator [Bacteroidales bacterium]|jgi:GntR family transcriptional regulator|nr:GntR family transcriptional regulator [Bacteroidales bacterium]MDD2264601.1 GntR family transcriptional regulator [Bacteroidales bacterium]MDD2831984.1 GntR family transcriptional regulator [Bacteroidales bacterium]MDD3208987.1 GntR family transcriptional regulator [Bacteroidales bacterium]MDD3697821.1 GntR family transcriptional regulator [Bacteroidales bacterium]